MVAENQIMLSVVVPIGMGGAVLLFLWVYCVVDVVVTDSMLVRNLPKSTWLFLVIFVPTVGSIVWLVAGRPEGASLAVGGQQRANYQNNPYRSETRGFEDSPQWKATTKPSEPAAIAASTDITESAAVRERRLLEWEAELKKREEALGDSADDAESPDA